MGYAEKRSGYYLARFKWGDKLITVKDVNGRVIHFSTKRAATTAANIAETRAREQTWRDPSAGRMTFGAWANEWYERQDLAPSTMQNYKHHLEEHLLPAFEQTALADIFGAEVNEWERAELRAGYSVSSVQTWRTTLSTILGDAVAEGVIPANPAVRGRGRGKRAGRSRKRGPEKVTTDALGALLIAERAALLTGRDDEFVMVLADFWTGLRWGELVGLETRFVRSESIRVEFQLWEDDTGAFHPLPPKDDSYRDIDLPPWLSRLISSHIARTNPAPCPCHGRRYVFSAQRSAHPRRSAFSDWIFDPATTGWFPSRGKRLPPRPVSIAAEPWPGAVLRGRGNADRATACWTPIARGLTPHGLRHCHKTLMAELRTPEILSHERLGHELGGIGGRYSHVSPAMVDDLMRGLTDRWNDALDARLALGSTSPVGALDRLLGEHRARGQTDRVRVPEPRLAHARLRSRRPATPPSGRVIGTANDLETI
ncbi:LacI family transcriptional regulator [Jiangella ureilytica]|uniref:LacI family transcriptional regulator n=1 Tax=Jiangella ureilytica TaxID=2530374 RepID=A0A4R4RD67_9ACTN|nr:site-specific integrase [Jiangella ureilytica]TDC47094.1 LacI family transcriptional regulator [Jiangella ureilytica]